MKRLLLLIPIGALAALAMVPLTAAHTPKASAATSPMTCTINHWVRDYSQAGTPFVAVDPADNDQLIDGSGAGYPHNYIFELCQQAGRFYLMNQMPSGMTHPWIGENSALGDAVTDTADGPGGWEAFSITCAGVNHEWLVFQANNGGMFTIVGGGPGAPDGPTVWAHGPIPTEYEISGVCNNGTTPLSGVS